MAVLVGIDEAGFGPILGPLVVSSATFSLPGSLLTADMWRVLKKSVSSKRKHLAGRLLITDSKKAYSKSLGIGHLERTVLASLRSLGKRPGTLSELLELLCPDSLQRLESYPWYKGFEDFSSLTCKDDVEIASAVFRDDLASNGMELVRVESRCLDVGYYNRMVTAVKNKASVLFTATCRLVKNAFDNFGDEDLQIIIDRQGGRVHYRRVLQRMFENMELKVLKESSRLSSYQLRQPGHGTRDTGHVMRLHFNVGADDNFLPVALASMVSKFIRELLVGRINRYFINFHAQLKPTAGYWKDGLRFIEELKTIPDVRYDSSQLIRCR